MNALIEKYGQQRAAELRSDGHRHRLAAKLRPRKVNRRPAAGSGGGWLPVQRRLAARRLS